MHGEHIFAIRMVILRVSAIQNIRVKKMSAKKNGFFGAKKKLEEVEEKSQKNPKKVENFFLRPP